MKRTIAGLAVVLALSSQAWAADGAAGIDQWMPYNANGKWGFVTRDSAKVEFILPPQFEMAMPFRQGRAAVRKGKLWGFIDEKGAVVIPHQFDEIQRGVFRSGIAVVKKDFVWGVIDLNGKEILPAKYQEISLDEKAGRLIVGLPNPKDENDLFGIHGIYDLTGKMLLPVEYANIYPRFKNGVTVVEKDKKFAFANADGKLLTPLAYDQVLHSDIPDFIAIKEKEKVNDLYDEQGKLRFSAKGEYVGSLSDNRAVFKDSTTKNYGYYDEKGKIALPVEFVTAGTFSEGLAVVKRKTGGPVEIIDPSGKSLGKAEKIWTRLDKYKNGVLWLQHSDDNKVYLYDKKLALVFPQGFTYAADFDANDLARAQMPDKKYGLINKKGEWVVKAEWTAIEPSSVAGQYLATKEKERAVVDSAGKVVFAPQAVVLEKWDADFVRVVPPGFHPDGEYFCFMRKDGIVFYDQRKAE